MLLPGSYASSLAQKVIFRASVCQVQLYGMESDRNLNCWISRAVYSRDFVILSNKAEKKFTGAIWLPQEQIASNILYSESIQEKL